MKLTPAQWQIFQDNQKKPPVSVPAEPAAPGAAPGQQPSPGDIAVEQDRSTFIWLDFPPNLLTTCCYYNSIQNQSSVYLKTKSVKVLAIRTPQGGNYILVIPGDLWPVLQTNERFAGIKPTPNPSPKPDGTRTVKLTPAQWQIFQDNMKKPSMLVPVDDSVPDKMRSDDDKAADNITVQQDPSMWHRYCSLILLKPLARTFIRS